MLTPATLSLPRARISLWPAVVLAGLLAIALIGRLANIDAYTGKFDEGIRAEQLLLMSAGFRPVRDIFAAQGPLSLDIFYPPYLVFGQTLAAARAAVVLYSLLGIMAVFWVGGLAGGRLGACLAAGLLVASPLYLKNSRLALLEVPALVPATLALGGALLFQCRGDRRWLCFSAITLAVALLIKPMVLGVAVPIGLALMPRPGRQLSDFVIFGAVAAGIGALVVLLYGPREVWEQVVVYRGSAREASDWSLKENWSILREELRDEQLPIYGLAIASGLYLAIRSPRWGIPLAAWPLVNLGLLLVYSPLQFKHAVILLPPMALVVGGALTSVWRELRQAPTLVRRLPAMAGGLLLLWYATSLPAVVRQHWLVMSAATERGVETYAEETELIPRLSGPDDFIIVDDPIVAFNSRRLVPPNLVDTSSYRVRSGALSGAEVVGAAERRDVKLLVLFSDGLRDLDSFDRFVNERYRAVRIWERQNNKDRTLYLREDANFEAARTLLAPAADRTVRADFGGDLRLLGYNLARDELRPGSAGTLTLYWEAIRPMATDYSVITRLAGAPGQPEAQTQRGLGGGGEGTASWEAGRWVVRSQTFTVPPRATPGDYRLYVALYDSKTRTSPPLTAGGEPGATELLLGSVRVR